MGEGSHLLWKAPNANGAEVNNWVQKDDNSVTLCRVTCEGVMDGSGKAVEGLRLKVSTRQHVQTFFLIPFIIYQS